MMHTLFIIGWTVLVTGFFCIITIAASFLRLDNNGDLPHKLAGVWARSILFASRIKVTVKGLPNITPNRSYIFMSNHQSNFDIPVLLAYLPVQFRWLAKAELFKIPIFGYAMLRAGYISINRSNRKSAIASLNQAAMKVRDGTSILIFPEGTRSWEHNIQPFKKGGFVMAVDTGAPIVPIILRGTRSIMTKGSWRINPDKVTLSIEKPIDTSGFTRDTKEDLIKIVRSVICEVFERETKFDTSA